MPETSATPSCNHSYQLTQDLLLFVQGSVAPAILAQSKPSGDGSRMRDRAIEDVYVRIVLWLKSLKKLNETTDLQAIGTGARSVFEQYLDLVWLEKFNNEEQLNRFWAFPDVDRYAAAMKVVQHIAKSPGSKVSAGIYQRCMGELDAKHQTVPALVTRLWGESQPGKPKWPLHWTGKNNLRERAAMLGPKYEDTYVEIYPTLCALVHPSPTPFAGDFRWLEVQVGYAYFYAFKHALEATELVIRALGVAEAIPNLTAFRRDITQWMVEARTSFPAGDAKEP